MVTVVVAATIAALPVVLLATRDDPYPDEWDSRVADLATYVEQERGLIFDHPVPVDFLTADEYADRTRIGATELSAEDRAQLEQATSFLRAVGLASGDIDLLESANDMADAGTLAFYDPQSQRVVVRGTEMTVNLRVTLVHELTHVLQDQHFDLTPALDGEDDTSDQGTAFTALVEGDAMRIETSYVAQLSADELDEYTSVYDQELNDSQRDLAEVPAALVASQIAPYAFGEPLVELIAAEGGNAAVDAAFADPPTTAEHMFDPRTYLDRQEPTLLDAPGLPGGVQEQTDSGELGVVDVYLVLADRIDPFAALDAADGWGNGAWISYERDGRTCVDITVEGDTDADDQQLRDAFGSWVTAMPPEAGASVSVADESGDLGETLIRSCDPGPDVDATNGRALDVIVIPAARSQIAEMAASPGTAVDDAWASGDCFVRHLTLEQLVAGGRSSDSSSANDGAVADAFAACGV